MIEEGAVGEGVASGDADRRCNEPRAALLRKPSSTMCSNPFPTPAPALRSAATSFYVQRSRGGRHIRRHPMASPLREDHAPESVEHENRWVTVASAGICSACARWRDRSGARHAGRGVPPGHVDRAEMLGIPSQRSSALIDTLSPDLHAIAIWCSRATHGTRALCHGHAKLIAECPGVRSTVDA